MSAKRKLAHASGDEAAMKIPPTISKAQPVTTPKRGKAREVHSTIVTHYMDDFAIAFAALAELGTRRRFATKAQIRNNNALGALIRRECGWRRPPDSEGPERAAVERANVEARKRAAAIIKAMSAGKPSSDPIAGKVIPLVIANDQGRAPFDALRKSTEKEMARLAKSLPVHAWQKTIAGFGELGLGIIVAEAGDLGSYKSVAALWKRLGLAVINGERQRRHGDRDLATLHGYSPHRRAEIWTLADSMFKHQWSGGDAENGVAPHPTGPYGEHYGRKKAEYMQRVVDGILSSDGKSWTPKRADNAARRYMTKCLVRDLYQAWRQGKECPTPGNFTLVKRKMRA